MQKLTKKLSLVMVALMTVFTALSYVPAKAATVVPQVQFVGTQKTEFTAGERITFNLNAANYGGRVQYRVVLWNDTTKSYSDLWNTADRYYTNWQPYGNETLPLGWTISEPGTYRITVYAKRAGLANSKTALKGSNCDSFLAGPAFVVKPAAATPVVDSIAPVADVTVDEGATAVLPTEVTLNLSDKTTKTAKVTWAAVDTTKVGTVAVAGTVEGTDKKASVNVVVKAVALDVVSVNATNLKEINVVFNKTVDKKVVENIANYRLDGSALNTNDVAKVQEDGKTVVINLATPFSSNQSKHELEVKNLLVADKSYSFQVLDVTVPTVSKIESLGNKVVKVTFSEPVTKATAETRTNYKLNSYIVNGSVSLDTTGRIATITLVSAMTVGENKFSVANVQDYNNMYITKVTDQLFTVVKDEAAPVISSIEATLDFVTIKFSEPVTKVAAANVYWSDNDGTTKHKAYSFVEIAPLDGTTYKFDFTRDALPAKATKVYVEKVEDLSGSVIAAKSYLDVTPTVDTVRPEVKYLDFTKDSDGKYSSTLNKLEVTFNKTEIANTQFSTANNLVIKDEDGKIVARTSSAVLKKDANNKDIAGTFIVTLNTSVDEDTEYTVEVQNIQDSTKLHNTMVPQTFTINAGKITAPTVIGVAKSGLKVQITFSSEMALGGDGSVLDLEKYMVRYNGAWYSLPNSTLIEPSYDNKSVILTFDANAKIDGTNKVVAANISGVKVTLVKDSVGNKLAGLTYENTNLLTIRPTVTAAKLTGSKTVEVTFDQPLSNVDYRDFTVSGSNPVVDADYETVDGEGVVTLTLTTAIYTSPTLTITSTYGTAGLLDQPIQVGSGIAVTDKVKPALTTNASDVITGVAVSTPGVLTLAFTENVQAIFAGLNAGVLASDFVLTYGANSTKLNPGTDYEVSLATNVATFKILKANVSSSEVKIKTADTVRYIVDANSNSIAAIDLSVSDYDADAMKTDSAIQTAYDTADAAVDTFEALPLTTTAEITAAVTAMGTDAATTAVGAAATISTADKNALLARIATKKAEINAAATVVTASVANGTIATAAASTTANMTVVLKNAEGIVIANGDVTASYNWTVTGVTEGATGANTVAIANLTPSNQTTATVTFTKATLVDAGDTYHVQLVFTQGTNAPITVTADLIAQ